MQVFGVRALCALLLMAVGGCAGSGGLDGGLSESQAQHTIESALRDVQDIYYRETKASELVDAGLERIHKHYPAVNFSREGEAILAAVDGQPVSDLSIEDDNRAAADWAEEVVPVLVQIAAALKGDDKPDLADLTDIFLHGVSDGLDASTYVSPREAKAERQQSQDRPGILNIRVKPEDSGQRVVQIYNASTLGSGLLRRGDLIVGIDGVPTIGITKGAFHDLIRGAVGSPIVLTILRSDDPAPLAVTLQRERINANSVAVFREGDIQRIVVAHFHGPAVDDLRDVLQNLKNDPPPAKGAILDLRNNPGGLLQSAISASDFFLSEGRILTTRGRHEDSHQSFKASSKSPMIEQPLVVLVDQHTAAGSEIVAAALQDNGRAVVVGSTSFGKGTIQTILPLPNAGLFSLTWTEMHTAAGYRIDKRGVIPTVCTGGSVTVGEVVGALRSGGGVIDRATRTRDVDPDDSDAVEAFRALCPPREDQDEDVSLQVARAILAAPAIYERLLSPAQ